MTSRPNTLTRERAFSVLLGCVSATCLYILGRFAFTGEMLVRHGRWATFNEAPASVVLGAFSFLLGLVVSGISAYLVWTGAGVTDRHFRMLDRRSLIDRAARQDRSGRDVDP